MLVLTRLLREKGHRITLMGTVMDRDIAQSVADNVVVVPSGNDYYNINEYVQGWLERNWDEIFNDDPPDLVLNCGWPFFTSMPFFASKVEHVIFHDYGIVPIHNYTDGSLKIQNKVRNLRKRYMRFSSYVITISDYITKTTYEILPHHGIPVKTIHLGVDHMESCLWNSNQIRSSKKGKPSVRKIAQLKKQGYRVLINLGRWETGYYKFSESMYELLRELKASGRKCAMLVLGPKDNVKIPDDLKGNIHPLGYIDDDELVDCMRTSDLGVSSSLWEGHNLPMPEMQYYEKPVLAFNVGAHPEVVLHPWYLCNSVKEMARKANRIFEGRDLTPEIRSAAYQRFKEYFTWDRCAQSMYEVFEKVVSNDKYSVSLDPDYLKNNLKTINIVMDMTNPSRDEANPGIIRTCRQLAAKLQYYINPIFVIRDDSDDCFVLPNRDEYKVMGSYNGPLVLDEELLSPMDHRITLDEYFLKHLKPGHQWLLLPDIIHIEDGLKIQGYCNQRNLHITDIFYDDIPYKLHEMYGVEGKDRHAGYMMRLTDSDLVLSISQYSTDCLVEFCNQLGISSNNVKTAEIPGEFTTASRTLNKLPTVGTCKQFVMVSTLEPRKNHRQVIEACLQLEKLAPDLNFKFVMIGNRFAGHSDIADYVQKITKDHPRIEWRGILSDEDMDRVIKESAFTIYASTMEGYGLPIMESLWRGKPCLCHNAGAMAELAAEGGCYTVDVNNPEAICKSLFKLCTDSTLLKKLEAETINRKIKTWREYAENVLAEISQAQARMDERDIPDRRFGGSTLSPLPHLLPNIPGELCRYISLSKRTGMKVGITLGQQTSEVLHYLGKYYDLLFALDCTTISPMNNVVCISNCTDEAIKEISLGLNDYGVMVDALFVDSTAKLSNKVQMVKNAFDDCLNVIAY